MKPFFYMTKKSRQKFKYLENKNIISKGLYVAKNCLCPEGTTSEHTNMDKATIANFTGGVN